MNFSNILNSLFDLLKNHQWDQFIEYIEKNKDIDINVRDNQNNYLLTYAILFNKPDIVKLLIKYNARIDIVDNENRSILYIAIKYDYQEIITILIEAIKNTIGVSLFDIRDKDNLVPIHYTILFKNITALEKLLNAGASPNVFDKNNYNTLHLSVYVRSYDMCVIILKYNIDINARINSGETALHIACNLQLYDIASLLISEGINVNIQDYDNEFTALHYSVNLNNKALISLLLNNGSNPNIQDVIGNTALHYAVSENNLESVVILNTYKPNLNLWNLDGAIPLLLALEINPINLTGYIDIMLNKSNVNIQDNEGNTCLHYLCTNGLWKEYRQTLAIKKLDIFLPNKEKIKPINLINKKDINSFIDLVVDSYLYRLRKANVFWSEEWENMCKKELYYNTMTDDQKEKLPTIRPSEIKYLTENTIDVCKVIITDKIKKMYESKTIKMCNKSYPLKRGYMCIGTTIEEGTDLQFCTFTGSTIDILIGLIFLLKRHPDACSTISSNFYENKALCKYYKSIGIIINAKCEFLNFEIVWVENKLYLNDDFYDNFKKCITKKDKRFVIIPLGIELRHGSHANYLLYDKNNNEIERFEPNGSNPPNGFNYHPILLDNILELRFKEINNDIIYIRPENYLPKIGFQLLDIYESNKKKIGDPGFCGLWSIWYIDMRLTYKDLPRNKLVKQMIQTIREQNISFKNLIRNYSIDILKIRDIIFKKANIDINKWMADDYTEHQLAIILKGLTKEVEDIMM